MRRGVVAPVGTSPPVVTQLVKYLECGREEQVHDLVLLVTDNELARESAELVYSGIEVNHPRTRVHIRDLKISDTARRQDQLAFLSEATRIIQEERVEHHVDRLYLNVAGGRKNMSICLYLLGQLYAVERIFHVIHPGVSIFNEELERRRHEIHQHFLSDNLTEYYEHWRDVFDPLLFPPLDDYEVLSLPFIPFPPHILVRLKHLLSKDYPCPISESGLNFEYISLLERAGLIVRTKNKVHPTETGLILGSAIWSEEG